MLFKSKKVLQKLDDEALHAELVRAMEERDQITDDGINSRNLREIASLNRFINTAERLLSRRPGSN